MTVYVYLCVILVYDFRFLILGVEVSSVQFRFSSFDFQISISDFQVSVFGFLFLQSVFQFSVFGFRFACMPHNIYIYIYIGVFPQRRCLKDDVLSSRAEVGPRTRGEYWAVVASRFVSTPQLASAS